MYNIILCGGYVFQSSGRNFSGVTKQINAKNFNNEKYINSMKIKRVDHRLICCRGEVYVFGGFDEDEQMLKSVEKYSFASSRWEIIGRLFNGRRGFDVCRFINNLCIFGGCDKSCNTFYSCKMNYTNNNKWYKFARKNKGRILAANTVYKGRVVVSGGY